MQTWFDDGNLHTKLAQLHAQRVGERLKSVLGRRVSRQTDAAEATGDRCHVNHTRACDGDGDATKIQFLIQRENIDIFPNAL